MKCTNGAYEFFRWKIPRRASLVLFILLLCEKFNEVLVVTFMFLEAVTNDAGLLLLLPLILFFLLLSREPEDNISFTKAFCGNIFFGLDDDDEAVIIRDARLEYCPEDTLNNDVALLLFLLVSFLLLLPSFFFFGTAELLLCINLFLIRLFDVDIDDGMVLRT